MKHYQAFLIISALLILLGGCNDGQNTSQNTESLTRSQPVDADGHDEDNHGSEDGHDDDHGDEHDDEHQDVGDIIRLSESEARSAGIKTLKAEGGDLKQTLELPAEIRFDTDRVANVSPKVGGVIGRLYVNEGDSVAAGDTLALIRSRELASLKADWQTANTRLNLAEKALLREEKLFADQITSEADLEQARAEYGAAKAARDAAENQLHAAGVSHSALSKIESAPDGDNANAYLTAPIAGVIIRRTVTLGETVSSGDAGGEPLFTIADSRVLWADIAVFKQDLGSFNVGTPLSLKAPDGTVLATSTISFLLPVINETSRTATARAIIENPSGTLRPGQFVTAELWINSSVRGVKIPENAVQQVEGRSSVFVPVEGGFAVQNVDTGRTFQGEVEILSGLEAGDTFVSDGAFTLKAHLEKNAFGDGHGH